MLTRGLAHQYPPTVSKPSHLKHTSNEEWCRLHRKNFGWSNPIHTRRPCCYTRICRLSHIMENVVILVIYNHTELRNNRYPPDNMYVPFHNGSSGQESMKCRKQTAAYAFWMAVRNTVLLVGNWSILAKRWSTGSKSNYRGGQCRIPDLRLILLQLVNKCSILLKLLICTWVNDGL